MTRERCVTGYCFMLRIGNRSQSLLDLFLTLHDIIEFMGNFSGTSTLRGEANTGRARMDAKGEADTVLTYGFAGFRLSTRRQCLHYGDEEFALSTKLYYLLLAFLERPGEVLTKDDITRAAWPNQVVTDAAIAKQVQRLRLLLVDTGRDTPLIETHRGVGYRLTCNVTPDYVASASETARQYRRRWPQLVATTLLLLGVSTWLVVDSRGNRTVIGNDVAPTLAMQPVVGDAAALTEGVAEYLAARLGPSTDIAPMVSLEGEPVSGTDLSGLRLAKVRIGPVAAFHLARQGATYQLTLSFRDGERSRQEQLAGDSITALLDDAVRWVGTQAGSLPSAPAPAASYALASYFEGLAATGSGGACGRAMEYYQAAIAANPEFHRARLRLARCARALGRPLEAAAAAVALLAREGHTVPAL
ncbi:MAG: winged helix-turn-helix domain-containing protein, partial [Haliea sp.]|uniref:winged helix-turn-helix domain-containing protein n=1 Tax=Haliea sp. TaxID=1932666 RepID=UPI0032EAA6B0